MALPFEQHALAELAKVAPARQGQPTVAPINPSKQWAELKGREHDQIQTLIERDEKSGTLNPAQAAEYHAQNDKGRLLLYGVGGEFDDYLSRDELNANLTEQTLATRESRPYVPTITLFNPAWGDGKAEVTLGELSQAFDRKEAVALVDTLRAEQSLEIEGLEWDPEHRKVFAAVKNAEGKFRVEMDLDDGTHGTPKYHVTDKNGEVVEIGEEDLSHLGKPPYQQTRSVAEGPVPSSPQPIPEDRANALNQKFTVMAKFKKQFFREGGVPERLYQEPRPMPKTRSERAIEKPGKPVLPPTGGPTPSMPTGGGSAAMSEGGMPGDTAAKTVPQKDMVRPAHHDTPALTQQPAAQPAPQPEPQRPNRFAGLPMPGRKKGPSLWPALAAGGLSGGTIIGAASGTGLFTLLFSKHDEATAFLETVQTVHTFLQTFFA